MNSLEAIELFFLIAPLNVLSVFVALLLYDLVGWLTSLFPPRSKAVDRG
ncbi:hypothetical protein [Marinobacterium iners]|uniref:Uncharacterized protein n=1 Tax=Marinobacterium iners DSM 11526 TaxID=1122198 RepID=A0A1H4H7S1_9GAMM|nr:hypothetical protein [Marinobacterium iners]SEB17887.1 hypothetical protein SAMN02745729_13122 [Marinobacterium iners DSM 11526]